MIAFFFSAYFRNQCRNEFCMQKYPNKGIFIGFAENSHFSERLLHGDFYANGRKIDIY